VRHRISLPRCLEPRLQNADRDGTTRRGRVGPNPCPLIRGRVRQPLGRQRARQPAGRLASVSAQGLGRGRRAPCQGRRTRGVAFRHQAADCPRPTPCGTGGRHPARHRAGRRGNLPTAANGMTVPIGNRRTRPPANPLARAAVACSEQVLQAVSEVDTQPAAIASRTAGAEPVSRSPGAVMVCRLASRIAAAASSYGNGSVA